MSREQPNPNKGTGATTQSLAVTEAHLQSLLKTTLKNQKLRRKLSEKISSFQNAFSKKNLEEASSSLQTLISDSLVQTETDQKEIEGAFNESYNQAVKHCKTLIDKLNIGNYSNATDIYKELLQVISTLVKPLEKLLNKNKPTYEKPNAALEQIISDILSSIEAHNHALLPTLALLLYIEQFYLNTTLRNKPALLKIINIKDRLLKEINILNKDSPELREAGNNIKKFYKIENNITFTELLEYLLKNHHHSAAVLLVAIHLKLRKLTDDEIKKIDLIYLKQLKSDSAFLEYFLELRRLRAYRNHPIPTVARESDQNFSENTLYGTPDEVNLDPEKKSLFIEILYHTQRSLLGLQRDLYEKFPKKQKEKSVKVHQLANSTIDIGNGPVSKLGLSNDPALNKTIKSDNDEILDQFIRERISANHRMIVAVGHIGRIKYLNHELLEVNDRPDSAGENLIDYIGIGLDSDNWVPSPDRKTKSKSTRQYTIQSRVKEKVSEQLSIYEITILSNSGPSEPFQTTVAHLKSREAFPVILSDKELQALHQLQYENKGRTLLHCPDGRGITGNLTGVFSVYLPECTNLEDPLEYLEALRRFKPDLIDNPEQLQSAVATRRRLLKLAAEETQEARTKTFTHTVRSMLQAFVSTSVEELFERNPFIYRKAYRQIMRAEIYNSFKKYNYTATLQCPRLTSFSDQKILSEENRKHVSETTRHLKELNKKLKTARKISDSGSKQRNLTQSSTPEEEESNETKKRKAVVNFYTRNQASLLILKTISEKAYIDKKSEEKLQETTDTLKEATEIIRRASAVKKIQEETEEGTQPVLELLLCSKKTWIDKSEQRYLLFFKTKRSTAPQVIDTAVEQYTDADSPDEKLLKLSALIQAIGKWNRHHLHKASRRHKMVQELRREALEVGKQIAPAAAAAA